MLAEYGLNKIVFAKGCVWGDINNVGIDEIEINWPNAKHSTEIIKNIQMGKILKIKEGMGKQ